jgi:hypothetical protein
MPGTIDVSDTVVDLERACRILRQRALANHWTYSLPEHTELCRRLKAALLRDANQQQHRCGVSCDAANARQQAAGSGREPAANHFSF